MDNRLINQSKEEKLKDIFPASLSKIIQSYLSNDKPDNDEKVSLLTFSSFFETPSLLYAHRLAYYAVWGQPEPFEAILKICPEALLVTVEIQRPQVKERTIDIEEIAADINSIKATPYQILLQEDDNHIRDEKNRTFLEMAKSYYPPNATITAEQQEKHWFKDWDENTHVKKLQTEFDKVLKAFDESKAMTQNELDEDILLQKAIQNFKKHLKATVLQAKKNCISRLWDYSAQKHTANKFEAYGNYDSDKNRLMYFQVYGAIDASLSIWSMQVLHQGIYNLVINSKLFKRMDVSSYYSFSNSSRLHLGANCYMSIFGICEVMHDWGSGGRRPFFSYLCEQLKLKSRENNLLPSRKLLGV